MKRRTVAIAAAILGIIGAAGAAAFFWQDAVRYVSAPPAPPSDQQLAEFQIEAESACKCIRQSGDPASRSGCSRRLEKMTAKWEWSGMAAACEPISTSINCVGDGDRCYTSGYDLVVGSQGPDGPILCTAAEAQIVEAIFAEVSYTSPQATNEEMQRAYRAADKAAEKAAHDIAAGRPVKYSKLQKGCAG
ncbi:hypothetical protein [Sphingomonas sp. LaA6.9]|uniref:hypothetical protein n=1 Tax=Sphingomonas sp. LaA6.9 TaxID=2919914 RepID=UPI001F4F5F9E|nr:hypothetical protein [Sphingomonas sp. LaA6.9]MCJ8156814.1 hypothetical protein [Sphingomonas sp. LaA6.9]